MVAANIDTVFLVSGLDGEFNPRRVERYLVAASQSGAQPVVVLNKSDLGENVTAIVHEVETFAPKVNIYVVSAEEGLGIEPLITYLSTSKTVALLGSSGVGKSTLINRLLGYERQTTQQVRQRDRRGRHTTVHREMLLRPKGGVVIDTPGMRELRLWDTDQSLEDTFADITDLAQNCRFRDCRHRTEPGCAVARAII